MTELVHADIFFFVTTIVVVLLGIGGCIVLYYVVGILRNVRAITGKIEKASGALERDFAALRANAYAEGEQARSLLRLLFGFLLRKAPRAGGKKIKKIADDE
jgi:hypothetical protein